MRIQQGCDAPAPRPYYQITCPSCGGAGALGGTECTTCGGSGRKRLDRCPSSMATPDLREAFRAYGRLREYGTWPVAGGVDDQAASFVAFVDLVDAEIAACRRDDAEHRERMRALVTNKP